ncbi:MAG: DinB family protein [Candidatus Brachytrichaceae bacterium NZ_4S206]|jgi:uncharacterized damage-inducible protein DinB
MNTKDLELLLDYNYWANRRILDQAAKVSDEQFVAPQSPGFSAGSLHGTLVHIMGSEWAWRMRLQHGVSPAAALKPVEFPNLAALIARWQTEEQRMREYVAGLTDDDLSRVVTYKTLVNPQARQHTVEHCLTHMVFHGMQHRSEAAAILTNFGHSPGNIDLIYYLIEKGIP